LDTPPFLLAAQLSLVDSRAHLPGTSSSESPIYPEYRTSQALTIRPNSGVVTFDFQGETHSIDFLAQMAGFKSSELPAVLKCPLTVPLCNISTAPLSVMHPMHCLQAQLENI
jgi:hypothetical protein